MTVLLPARQLLQPHSVKALLEPPSGIPRAMRLTTDNVSPEAALQAPMVRAARLLMGRALDIGGLKLTPAGSLKRADVWPVFDQTEWPGLDKAQTLAMNKVINEQDAFGVFFARVVMQHAGLLRKRAGFLQVSKAGRALLLPEAAPALLGRMFEATFWKTNLQDFDRIPLEFWPQHHMGLVLWSLSVAAHDWSRAGSLVEICTLMETIIEPAAPQAPEFAFVMRALRPLAWLGLMETRDKDAGLARRGAREYRKAPLFDELLRFEVSLREIEGRLQ